MGENKKPKKKLKIALAIICALIIIAIPVCYYLVYISYNHLTVNSYDINSNKVNSQVKFVVVGDLHDNTFKDDNKELLRQIKAQNPDFIIADGDILNDDSPNSDIAMSFIKRLVKIAPVYYALGNHELEYMENQHSEELLDEIKSTGDRKSVV